MCPTQMKSTPQNIGVLERSRSIQHPSLQPSVQCNCSPICPLSGRVNLPPLSLSPYPQINALRRRGGKKDTREGKREEGGETQVVGQRSRGTGRCSSGRVGWESIVGDILALLGREEKLNASSLFIASSQEQDGQISENTAVGMEKCGGTLREIRVLVSVIFQHGPFCLKHVAGADFACPVSASVYILVYTTIVYMCTEHKSDTFFSGVLCFFSSLSKVSTSSRC